MALFKLDASCEFRADSIDNAFLKLAKHFSALASSEDSDLIATGEINIEPIRNAYEVECLCHEILDGSQCTLTGNHPEHINGNDQHWKRVGDKMSTLHSKGRNQ